MKKVLIAVLIIFALILLSFCGDDEATAPDENAAQEAVTEEMQMPTDSTDNATEEATQKPTEYVTEIATQEPTEPPAELPTDAPTEPPTDAPTEPPTQAVEETTKKEVMVWIPSSGTKYHSRSGCSNMKNPSQVTLEKAQSWGYTPCKKCY